MVPEIDIRITGIPHIAVEQGEDDRIRLIKRLATSSQESDCPSASNRIGFQCLLQVRDAQSTTFEFGPYWHGETRGEMFE